MAAVSDASGWPPWFEENLLCYLRDPILWPVTFAVLGHGSVVLAPLFLHLARGFAPASIFATGLLFALSVYVARIEWRAIARPGVLTAALSATWLGGVALAWTADHYGVY